MLKIFSKFFVKHFILILLAALIIRKLIIGKIAMDYVEQHKDQIDFETMISNQKFKETIQDLSNSDPQLIVILNQHALNMTLNWLCNTANMDQVHDRTLIVTLDNESKTKLQQQWPKLKIFAWIVPALKDPFNYGDGKYQLFYLFRSNLAQALIHFAKPFWMIQQDTFWRENLISLKIEALHPKADMIFDMASEGTSPIIAGGYFFVKPTCSAKAFFKQLSFDLERFYVPDNAYMTSLCANKGLANCEQVPFNLITNWIWLHEFERMADPTKIPALIQFDGDTKLGGKLQKMKSLGFYFLTEDGKTCNFTAVEDAKNLMLNHEKSMDTTSIKSYSHLQFGLYTWFIDQFYKFEITKKIMEKIIFPNAHYFMITL